jgi:hypothetical protein
MRDLSKLSDDDARAVQRYLDDQRTLQARLARGLDLAEVKRNQRLIWLWDFLSLGLCLRWHGRSLDGITIHEDTIEPWPFAGDEVRLHTEGRRLTGRFDDEAEMRAALDEAPWVTLRFDLARRA